MNGFPQPLTVSCDGLDSAAADLERGALASLPSRWLLSDNGTADVVAIDGCRAGWTSMVEDAIQSGRRGALVIEPGCADPGALTELADHAADEGCVVAVASPYITDPAWDSALPQVQSAIQQMTLLESVIVAPHRSPDALFGALLEQLGVVEMLLGSTGDWRAIHVSDSGYVLHGEKDAIALSLCGTLSHLGRLEILLSGPAQRWAGEFVSETIARPGIISRHDSNGAATLPPIFEGGRRATWLQLHRAIVGDDSNPTYSLNALAHVMRLAIQILGRSDGPAAR